MSPLEKPDDLDIDAQATMRHFCYRDIPIVAEVNYIEPTYGPSRRVMALAHYDYGILSGPELEFIDEQMMRINMRRIAPMVYERIELDQEDYERRRAQENWAQTNRFLQNPDAV